MLTEDEKEFIRSMKKFIKNKKLFIQRTAGDIYFVSSLGHVLYRFGTERNNFKFRGLQLYKKYNVEELDLYDK